MFVICCTKRFEINMFKPKIDFQYGRHGGHLEFPMGTILAIFNLQVTPILPIKFQINWHFGLGVEVKNGFSRWRPRRPSWISHRKDFSFFDLQVTPMLPTKFQVNWSFGSGEEAKNRFSRWPLAAIFDFRSERFKQFFIYKSHQCYLSSFKANGRLVQEKKPKNIFILDF